MPNFTPADESERLAALHAYGILDTPPEVGFEHVTAMVTRLFQVPIAAVVLLDAKRQWFKSVRGFDARETPRELSFCEHVLTNDSLLVIPDAKADPHFVNHPFVTGEPFVRFYAGAPLRTPEGHTLGALCLADQQPREWTAAEEQLLSEFAVLVEDELLLRRVAKELREKTTQQRATPSAWEAEHERRPSSASSKSGSKAGVLSQNKHSRQIVEQASDAIFVYDLAGQIVDVNATACAMVGYEREALLRLRVSDIEVSFDPLKTPARWQALIPGEVVSIEGLNRRKNGSLFPAEARISMVETSEGRFLLALVRDISERKQAEKLLHVRVSQQQAVAKLGTTALNGIEVASLMEEIVKSIGSTLGIEICRIFEHVPKSGELVPRADLGGSSEVPASCAVSASLNNAAGYAFSKGEPVAIKDARADRRFEASPWLEELGAVSGLNVTIGGDGSHLPVYGVLAAYTRKRRDFTGDDVFFVQTVANLLAAAIARQGAVDELHEVQERFRLASVHAPYPAMLHTDDGEVLLVNDAWTHLTGYLPEQLRTMESWLQLAYGSEAEREEVKRFLSSIWDHVGTIVNPGRRIRCADGEQRIWDVSGVNLGRLPDGRWLRLATAVDVTERRQQETALIAAKEEAERANLAKSQFLSRMSHELRTPLNAILGFGQVLEMSGLGEQDEQAVTHILKGGRHLLAMVDEVLDLARVEAGELSLKIAPVPLDRFVSECIGMVARMAESRGIACTVAINLASHRSALADEQRLRQVILNLLSNAIKYNHEGGRVSLICAEARADRVCLRVKDSGPGISAEGLARLFVPFERLGQEFGEVEGTGLGLVVSRELVEAMGGILSVESEVGSGSTFIVELPLDIKTVSPVKAEIGPPLLTAATAPEPVSATVLYIEDNVSNVQVIQTVLSRLRPHWRFLSARDGQSGLQLAREHLPDVVLLDLQLPGMHGDQVLSELRAAESTRQLSIVLLSADATAHSRERLLSSGADDYVSKPFNVAELLDKLDAFVTKKHN